MTAKAGEQKSMSDRAGRHSVAESAHAELSCCSIGPAPPSASSAGKLSSNAGKVATTTGQAVTTAGKAVTIDEKAAFTAGKAAITVTKSTATAGVKIYFRGHPRAADAMMFSS